MGKTKKRKKLKLMKRISRDAMLDITADDVTDRFGTKIVPDKRKKSKKFDWKKEIEDAESTD